jgi:hypothetical protein
MPYLAVEQLRIRQRIEASLAQKCLATLAVQRGWHSAFSRGYGIDYERAMQQRSFGLLQADLERQITDQLTRIVGVQRVTGYTWRRDNERAWVRFVVQLQTGGRFQLTTSVPPTDVVNGQSTPSSEYPGGSYAA